MRLPSIQYLATQATQSFRKFPLTILSSILGAAVGIYLVEMEDDISDKLPYINLLLCAAVGIPLYFCAAIFSSKKKLDQKLRWILYGVATVILLLIYWSLPNVDVTQNTSIPYIRYAIYSVTAHLLVAFIPFLTSYELNGFWNYNKVLFIRVWVSVLYAGVLYIGLILALVSLDLLFDIEIPDELYFQLFIFVAGVFITWFYVSNIPDKLDELDRVNTYPNGLKVFAQYILLPLLILYLVILYGYGAKIILLWDWPRGIVSYLIVCVAVLGILNQLLIYPYGYWGSDNEWIKKFVKAYYYLLIPLVVLLFIAVGMRIGDYGITINRYIIVLLGIWLSIVCLYFSIGRSNIKFIPISLASVVMLSSFGPWGMFSVAENSQVNRLATILTKAGMLKDGNIQDELVWNMDSLPNLNFVHANLNEGLLSDSLHNEVYSIMEYLDNNHGFASIRGWYEQDIDQLIKAYNIKQGERWDRYEESWAYMTSFNLKAEYISTYYNNYVSFYAKTFEPIDIRTYDYQIAFDAYNYEEEEQQLVFEIDGEAFRLNYSFASSFDLNLISEKDTMIFPIHNTLNALMNKYSSDYNEGISISEMEINAIKDNSLFRLNLSQLSVSEHQDTLEIDNLKGILFIKLN